MKKSLVSRAVDDAIADGQYQQQAQIESKKWNKPAVKQGIFKKLISKFTGVKSNAK